MPPPSGSQPASTAPGWMHLPERHTRPYAQGEVALHDAPATWGTAHAEFSHTRLPEQSWSDVHNEVVIPGGRHVPHCAPAGAWQ